VTVLLLLLLLVLLVLLVLLLQPRRRCPPRLHRNALPRLTQTQAAAQLRGAPERGEESHVWTRPAPLDKRLGAPVQQQRHQPQHSCRDANTTGMAVLRPGLNPSLVTVMVAVEEVVAAWSNVA